MSFSLRFSRPVLPVTREVLRRLLAEHGGAQSARMASTTIVTMGKAIDGMPILLKAADALDAFACSQQALSEMRAETSA